MVYALIVYFNWLPATVLYRLLPHKRRTSTGWMLLVATAIVQVFAFTLHLYGWHRLHGQPDAMYAWIVPAVLVLFTCVAIVVAFGLAILRQPSNKPDGN